jgi:hypothetical protein
MARVDSDGTWKDHHDDPQCPEKENLKLARRRHRDPGRPVADIVQPAPTTLCFGRQSNLPNAAARNPTPTMSMRAKGK